jgi:hypothetical protein
VAQDVRVVNELTGAEAALYGGLGGGLVGGVLALLGVVVERLLRLTGRLRGMASKPSFTLIGAMDEMGRQTPVDLLDADETTDADAVEYRFAIDLFNGKEVPTGLRDVRVVFVHSGGDHHTSTPNDLETGRQLSGRLMIDELKVINIPPRQFVRKEMQGYFGKEEADALKTGTWERIEFVGEFPSRPILGSKTYRKTVTERSAWSRR